jgi:hypothetical protein
VSCITRKKKLLTFYVDQPVPELLVERHFFFENVGQTPVQEVCDCPVSRIPDAAAHALSDSNLSAPVVPLRIVLHLFFDEVVCHAGIRHF